MKMDRLQQASENSLVIQSVRGRTFGSFSTNRLDKKELEKFYPQRYRFDPLTWQKTRHAYVTRLFALL